MDEYNERLNYLNDKIDEIYADIKKNYGCKTELEGALRSGAAARNALFLLEMGLLIFLACVMLEAFVNGDGLNIILKYIVPGILVTIIYYRVTSKYEKMKECLELVELRESELEVILERFQDDRRALIAGASLLVHSYKPFEPIEIPRRTSGIFSAIMTVAVSALCLVGLSRLDYSSIKPVMSSLPVISYIGEWDENEAGAVSNVDGSAESGDKEMVIPGSYSQSALNGDKINMEFKWQYDFAAWTQTLDVDKKSYEYYKNKSRSIVGMDYREYINDRSDDAFIKSLADGMCKSGKEKGYSEFQQIELMVSFVQGLEYIPDEDENGNEVEYPKYPVETLVDGGGDCEDTAILLASLIRAEGYGVAIICMPEHVAVGIKGEGLEEVGSYYQYDGNKYYYVETTAPNWPIGQIPDDYKGKAVELVVIQ